MKPASSSKQRERDFQRQRAEEAAKGAEPSADGAAAQAGSDHKPRADKAARKRYLREYRKWLWPYRWQLFGILALALVTTGLDMVWPLAIRLIMDGALVGNAASRAARTGELLRLGA